MIAFNIIDYYYDKRMEFKIGKERIKLLEQMLRKLGNFKKDDIEVINYEYDKDSRNTIYEIKDDDNTSFKFYNFSLNYRDDNNRYSKNYYLKVKKENSLIEYTYDFNNLSWHLDFLDILRVIELKCNLTENRVIKLERKQNCNIKLIIEEEEKKYLIYFRDRSEKNDESLLEDFENMILQAQKIPKLNIENFINIIRDKNKISGCYVYKNNNEIAHLKLQNGELLEYSIIEENRKVNVKLYDNIKRTVERKQDDQIIKTEQNIQLDLSCVIVQSEVKRLLKTI